MLDPGALRNEHVFYSCSPGESLVLKHSLSGDNYIVFDQLTIRPKTVDVLIVSAPYSPLDYGMYLPSRGVYD